MVIGCFNTRILPILYELAGSNQSWNQLLSVNIRANFNATEAFGKFNHRCVLPSSTVYCFWGWLRIDVQVVWTEQEYSRGWNIKSNSQSGRVRLRQVLTVPMELKCVSLLYCWWAHFQAIRNLTAPLWLKQKSAVFYMFHKINLEEYNGSFQKWSFYTLQILFFRSQLFSEFWSWAAC